MKTFNKYFNIILAGIVAILIKEFNPEADTLVVYIALLLTYNTIDKVNEREAKDNTRGPDAEQANSADRYPAYKVSAEQQA